MLGAMLVVLIGAGVAIIVGSVLWARSILHDKHA